MELRLELLLQLTPPVVLDRFRRCQLSSVMVRMTLGALYRHP